MTSEIPEAFPAKLDIQAFAALLGTDRSQMLNLCGELIEDYDFHYQFLEGEAFEQTVLEVLKVLDNVKHKAAGRARKEDWERGWSENLKTFQTMDYDLSALQPKYISKYDRSRLFGRYIQPRDRKFEVNFYTVYRHYLFKTFLASFETIFEFGCGTGYNLSIMSQLFPEKTIVGLDWAESSVRIADSLRTVLKAPISGRLFDYFAPDQTLKIPENSAIITLNSLEQIGRDYYPFLEFLLVRKPSLCINSEPFLEMYNGNDLLDYLAIRYHNMRNYLSGYYDALRQLEREGKIEVLKSQRVPFGNLFHEGFSFVVWRII
jgi:SAM-dependent methyltransferase